MISFDLWIEGQYVQPALRRPDRVHTDRFDGLCALRRRPDYAPKLDALVLVPMFPHTLSSRPIVVDGKSEIKIVIDPSMSIYPPSAAMVRRIFLVRLAMSLRFVKKP